MKFNKYLYMAVGGAMTLMIAGAAILFAAPTAAAQLDEAPLASIIVDGDVQHRRGPGGQGQGANQEFLLAELGITQEEFDAAVATAKEAAITDALNEGLITEAQAEQLRSGEGRRGFHGRGIDRGQYLADALDISVEELNTAMENAKAAALDQALADGNITQEQYDLIQAGQALRDHIDREAIMANILGVTVDELNAAKEDGTVSDLVEATGLTREELRAANQAAHEAAIDDAIEAGVISAEQAEALQNAGQNRRGGGHGRGHGGGNGNFGPGTQGQNGGATAPAGLNFGSDA